MIEISIYPPMNRQRKTTMQVPVTRRIAPMVILVGLMLCSCLPTASVAAPLIFCCAADNDLLRVAVDNRIDLKRFDAPMAAIEAAGNGDGVLLLADGYPEKVTPLDAELFKKAAEKKLRLYVEYPSFLPGVAVGAPRGTHWERAVSASDVFAPALAKLRILAIHGCRFVPLKADNPHIVVGRVAGFDTAVYGLPKESFPILCELPKREGGGDVLVATTKLSHFVTGRYAPTDAWQAIWSHVFAWLQPGSKIPELKWVASVRPSFRAEESLPGDVEQQALRRGIDWYYNSRTVLHPSMMAKYNRPANGPEPASANPDLKQDWPFGHRVARMPDPNTPIGDGSLGVMEGFDARIFSDGTQPVRWWMRADCNGEIAGAMAAAGITLQNPVYLKTGGNIGDWLFFRSMMSQGNRADPKHPAYGLIGWFDSPQYCGPGSMDGYAVYYGDDNARSMLGMMLAAAAMKTDRYDERLLKCLLANLRTSGQLGFQPGRIDEGPLAQAGWQGYFKDRSISYSPHYQAIVWACHLWAYRQTGFELFLKRAKTAISMTMAAYPNQWAWTNGIQQERAKMLLPLAWLVRVEDTPEHRAWLRKMAEDLLAAQDPCGTIREEIGLAGQGGCPPPASNEAYGTAETPLIQTNGDAACDLLYTTNFAFVGLHEAAAATDDAFYRNAEEKLAKFLCRIQIRSKTHPELDGGWFRAFDFKRWEYWASNADAGWGAWSIESGWTQSWITSVLALRQMNTSLWDITKDSKIKSHFKTLRSEMLPDNVLATTTALRVKHAGQGKPITLAMPPAPQYAGDGPAGLLDGQYAPPSATPSDWLGFDGKDLDAIIDLGEPVSIKQIGVHCLQYRTIGIFLPASLRIAVSDDGKSFRELAVVKPTNATTQEGPLCETLTATTLDGQARYVRVRAENIGKIPAPHQSAGVAAWLFVDEIMINPEK